MDDKLNIENDQMDDQLHIENEQVDEIPPTSEVKDRPPEPQEVVDTPAKKEITRTRRIWRSFLIWLTVIAVSFLVGVLTLNYVRLRPTNADLMQANQSIVDLEEQISILESQLRNANQKADALQDADTHREFLQVQFDISTARLALANGDVASARASLAGTTQRLDKLLSEIQQADAGLAVSLPQRLSLVISGLEDNISNASVDLGLLAADLQDLVQIIFGE